MRTSNNLYRRLGLNDDASHAEIDRAYRTLAKVYQADGTAANEAMAKAFVEIAAAADILGDPKKRSLYEREYIDRFGELTDEGRRHRQRRRSLSVLVCVFLLSFGVAFWRLIETERGAEISTTARTGPEDPGMRSSGPAEGLPTLSEAQNKTETSPPREAMSNTPPPIPDEKGRAAASATDDHDYLPPSARRARSAEKPAPLQDSTAERPAETLPLNKAQERQTLGSRLMEGKRRERADRSRTARITKAQPDDIPSPMRQTQFRRQESSTMRTARCLVCLTNPKGKCEEICP